MDEVATDRASRARARARAKVFALLGDAGVSDRSDRLELAGALLGGERVASFTELDTVDLERLGELLAAWRTVQTMRMFNGSMLAEAGVVAQMRAEIDALSTTDG